MLVTHTLPPCVHGVSVCVRTCINTQYCLSLFCWTLPGVLKCVCVCMCGCSISLACTHHFVLLYLSGCVTSGWVVGVGFSLFFASPPPLLTLGVALDGPKIRRLHGQNAEVAGPRPPLPSVPVSLPPSLKLSLFSVSFLWFEFCLICWSLFGPSLRFYCPLTNYILFCQIWWVFLFHFLLVPVLPVFPPFIPPWPSRKQHKVLLGTCSARPSPPQECAVVHVNITGECDKSVSAFAAATQYYQEKTVEKWGRDLSLFLFPLGFKIRPELSDHK